MSANNKKSSNSDNKIYFVEKIVNKRYFGKNREIQYLVKWKDFTEEDNTWEPLKHLKKYNCKKIIDDYERTIKSDTNNNIINKKLKTNADTSDDHNDKKTSVDNKLVTDSGSVVSVSEDKQVVKANSVNGSDSNEKKRKTVDKKVYFIEKIVDKRFVGNNRLVEYLVKWKDYSDEENTWEPLTHLRKYNCEELISDY
jgi:chromobox protein 1